MKQKNYISKFRKQHLIDKTANLANIAVAVDCISEANEIAFHYLAAIECTTEQQGFIVHTHLNLIGRLFEFVEGMLVCIATKCPTSSEAMGRVVVEGSINLMYMASKGNEKSIIAFMASWVREHVVKLNEWKTKIQDKEYADRVGAQIDERLQCIELYDLYVTRLIEQFSVDKSEFGTVWPKSIYKRFEAIGKVEAYYENYHRLSGSSHITAEDTITYMLSLAIDTNKRMAIAKEAWAYSIMMSRLSSIFFIDAVAVCCIAHGLGQGEISRLAELKLNIATEVEKIAEEAGVPQV